MNEIGEKEHKAIISSAARKKSAYFVFCFGVYLIFFLLLLNFAALRCTSGRNAHDILVNNTYSWCDTFNDAHLNIIIMLMGYIC